MADSNGQKLDAAVATDHLNRPMSSRYVDNSPDVTAMRRIPWVAQPDLRDVSDFEVVTMESDRVMGGDTVNTASRMKSSESPYLFEPAAP